MEDDAAIELLAELEGARKEMSDAVEREEKLRQEVAAVREIVERLRLDVEALKLFSSGAVVAPPATPPNPRLPPCPTIFDGCNWTPDPDAEWNGERWANKTNPDLEWNGSKWVGPWDVVLGGDGEGCQ